MFVRLRLVCIGQVFFFSLYLEYDHRVRSIAEPFSQIRNGIQAELNDISVVVCRVLFVNGRMDFRPGETPLGESTTSLGR